MGTFTFSWKKYLTTLQIQMKGRQGAAFIDGLGYIHRKILCIVQHVNVNLCVFCFHLFQ